MKVTLIHNPDAGGNDFCTYDIVGAIRAAGHAVICQSSREIGWNNVLLEPADLVAIAGGDGIVGAVAKQLIGKPVLLTILPTGTANNIASTLGLTGLSIDQLIHGWAGGRRVQLDVGMARGPWGDRYFIEGLGVGLFTDTMFKLDARNNLDLAFLSGPKEKLDSVVRIMKQRLDSHAANWLSLKLDGRDFSGNYILLEVMNVRCIGPNLCITQAGPPGDGLLDVVLAAADQRDQISMFLSHRLEGSAVFPGLTVHQARQLHIECAGIRIHIDDEVWPKVGYRQDTAKIIIDAALEPVSLEVLLP